MRSSPRHAWEYHCHVREAREARGLTQEQIAYMVGVTRNTIHNIERGVSIPSVLIALRLAKTLQVSVSSIFEVQQRR